MKLQTELISKAAALREVQRRIHTKDFDFEPDKIFSCEMNEKDEEYLKLRYDDVKRIDQKIGTGQIKNVPAALQKRKVYMSMIINYMIRNHVVDLNFLKMEKLEIEYLKEKYDHHMNRTLFIEKKLLENEFLKSEIERLAEIGEPFYTKNGKEIAALEEKINEIRNYLPKPNLFRQYVNTKEVSYLKARIQYLNEKDENGGKHYPIENQCCKLIYWTWFDKKIKKQRDFPFGFHNLWYLTPTAQERLIDLIVKTYKGEYTEQIEEFRIKNNIAHKNNKRRTKKYSAKEKKDIVQDYKGKGLTQKLVISKVDFSAVTVKRYWN